MDVDWKSSIFFVYIHANLKRFQIQNCVGGKKAPPTQFPNLHVQVFVRK